MAQSPDKDGIHTLMTTLLIKHFREQLRERLLVAIEPDIEEALNKACNYFKADAKKIGNDSNIFSIIVQNRYHAELSDNMKDLLNAAEFASEERIRTAIMYLQDNSRAETGKIDEIIAVQELLNGNK